MKKGKRVYLEDLVEEDVWNKDNLPQYATFHNEEMMDEPFTVFAAGKNKIVVKPVKWYRTNLSLCR